MATKKPPTIKNQPDKHDQPTKQTGHPGQTAAPHTQVSTSRSNSPKTAMPAAKTTPQQKHYPRDQHASTAARNHRRQQTLGQRIRHLSSGSWLAIFSGVLVIGILVIAIIASRGTTTAGPTNTQGLLAVGTTAPAINGLTAADGKTYSLAQYKGQKVVVLEFFAPWCPHCQNETTALKQLQQEYGDNVQVLAVSASPYGRNYEQGDKSAISMSDIQWYSTTFGLNYPSLFDPSLKAANDYGIQGFPTQYIVNKQGVITYAGSGEMSYASLQQQVNQALGQ